METVEVIVRLPKDMYERALLTGVFVNGIDAADVGGAIIDGIVLPKGHDVLVELGKVIDIVTEYVPDDDGSVGNTNLKDLLYEVENMEQVIETDREGEDESD